MRNNVLNCNTGFCYSTYKLHCVPKNILDIFDCHLKTSHQILIIFDVNIPDTVLLSNAHSVSHLTYCQLLHYLGKADQAKYTWK